MPGKLFAASGVLLGVLVASVPLHAQNADGIAPPRKSDTFAITDSGRKVRFEAGELPPGTFEIAGIKLDGKMEVLEQARRLLGNTPSFGTGDASTGDIQICYRSASAGDNTHLFFGRGEVDIHFKLAAESDDWNTVVPCLQSSRVSRGLATASGIHLGESEAQLIRQLGLPTRRRRDPASGRATLNYDFQRMKKTDAREFAQFRKENPQMSEREAQENYGAYSQGESVRAVFSHGLLVQIYVDWSGSY